MPVAFDLLNGIPSLLYTVFSCALLFLPGDWSAAHRSLERTVKSGTRTPGAVYARLCASGEWPNAGERRTVKRASAKLGVVAHIAGSHGGGTAVRGALALLHLAQLAVRGGGGWEAQSARGVAYIVGVEAAHAAVHHEGLAAVARHVRCSEKASKLAVQEPRVVLQRSARCGKASRAITEREMWQT